MHGWLSEKLFFVKKFAGFFILVVKVAELILVGVVCPLEVFAII